VSPNFGSLCPCGLKLIVRPRYRHFGSEEAWVLGCWSSSRELCAICSQPAPLSRLRQGLPWSIALKAEPEQQRALIATDARF